MAGMDKPKGPDRIRYPAKAATYKISCGRCGRDMGRKVLSPSDEYFVDLCGCETGVRPDG
jgi:hypothetical protein